MFRDYHLPQPPEDVILENVSVLKYSIEQSLMAGSIRKYKFTVPFRHDVFKHLFEQKEDRCYALADFPPHLFPSGWNTVYSVIGDGCTVEFPVKMTPYLKWSRKCYYKKTDGSLDVKPRYFTECVIVSLNKNRCR